MGIFIRWNDVEMILFYIHAPNCGTLTVKLILLSKPYAVVEKDLQRRNLLLRHFKGNNFVDRSKTMLLMTASEFSSKVWMITVCIAKEWPVRFISGLRTWSVRKPDWYPRSLGDSPVESSRNTLRLAAQTLLELISVLLADVTSFEKLCPCLRLSACNLSTARASTRQQCCLVLIRNTKLRLTWAVYRT